MLLALLLPIACTAKQVPLTVDDTSGPVDTMETVPDDTSGDTSHDTYHDTSRDTSGDTDVGAGPLFSPPGGTFVDAIEVSLNLEEGEQAWYTTDGSLPSASDTPYVGALSFTEGVELRVLVRDAAGADTLHVKSYIRLGDDVEDFSSNLPLLLVYSTGDIDDAASGYTPVSFQLHDVGSDGRSPLLGSATTSSRAAVKERGSSTYGEPKHSYALELREAYSDDDDDEALLDMPADSDWVLYAPLDYDRALIRNALAFRLSNELGRYAPRTRFVEVFCVGNGKAVGQHAYQGVYVLMERIKVAPDRVSITPIGPDDVASPEVTGGYLWKLDRPGDGESGFTAGTAGGQIRFEFPLVNVDPEEAVIEREQDAYLTSTLNDLAGALTAADHTHDGVPYSDMVDVDAWVDHHILNTWAKNPDALRLSAYLHKDREGPIVAGPLWDLDRSMACTNDDRSSDPTWWDATNQTTDTTPMFTYGWYGPLFDDPAFTSVYWARFAGLLDDTLSDDHVGAVIDEMAAELEEAAPRNYDRWSRYPPRDGGFAAEIEALKGWMVARHAWIAECLESHPEDPRGCRGG